MYQPYPQDTQMPETRHLPAPASVLNAVRVMYVGAAASLLGIVIDVLTVGATKRAIEKHSHHLTASQINSSQHVLVIAFIIGGLIGAAAWFFLARSCLGGKNWAIGVWLVGLTAVVFLWRRSSTAFFKATPQ